MIDAFLCDLGKILSEKPAGNNVSLSMMIVNINIASFHLGRREKSGEAIALVEIDQIIDEDVLNKIKNLPQVVRANVINFK